MQRMAGMGVDEGRVVHFLDPVPSVFEVKATFGNN